MAAYLAALALALGLAFDTAAVAAARTVSGRPGFALPWLFGAAHALMAAIGWIAGRQAISVLAQWDHWVAFALLVFFGGRMIHASFQAPVESNAIDTVWELLLLTIATSVDALAAGLAIDNIGVPPAAAIALIGGVCVAVSTTAVVLGRLAGRVAGPGLSRIGGFVLIAVAIRILVLHTA